MTVVADDRVPVAICFGLGSGCALKRERFVVLECLSAVEPEARNAHHSKLYGQYVHFLPQRKVSRCAIHCADRRIGKRLRVERRCVLSIGIVPKANRVLCWPRHVTSPSRWDNRGPSQCAARNPGALARPTIPSIYVNFPPVHQPRSATHQASLPTASAELPSRTARTPAARWTRSGSATPTRPRLLDRWR